MAVSRLASSNWVRGGAGVAFPQDSLAAAVNPAGMVFAGDRFDLGMTFFRPIRSASITDSTLPINGPYDASRHKNYFIPELGVNHLVNPRLSGGVSIFGNGDEYLLYYRDPIARQHTGRGRLGTTVRLADRGL